MNYLKIEHSDVCNGIGLRCVAWCSGCSHRCENCFNQESWDSNNGTPFNKTAKKEIFNELSKDYIDGITLTGGDPLYEENLKDILDLVKEIHTLFPQKTIWLYTGYTWEHIMDGIAYDKQGAFFFTEEDKLRYSIISYIDVLVDGEYIHELRDLSLRFRGSSNQRLIDVQKSLTKGEIILWTTNQ